MRWYHLQYEAKKSRLLLWISCARKSSFHLVSGMQIWLSLAVWGPTSSWRPSWLRSWIMRISSREQALYWKWLPERVLSAFSYLCHLVWIGVGRAKTRQDPPFCVPLFCTFWHLRVLARPPTSTFCQLLRSSRVLFNWIVLAGPWPANFWAPGDFWFFIGFFWLFPVSYWAPCCLEFCHGSGWCGFARLAFHGCRLHANQESTTVVKGANSVQLLPANPLLVSRLTADTQLESLGQIKSLQAKSIHKLHW